MSATRPGDLMHPDLTPRWVDRVAVHRCINGQPVGRPLHHAEQVAVARRLTDAGHGPTSVAKLLGCSGDKANALIKEATECSD